LGVAVINTQHPRHDTAKEITAYNPLDV
jgi:hypothetical protein